jgi:hypothetical protein
MVRASHASSVERLVERQVLVPQVGRGTFAWSLAKIRIASLVLVGAAIPAVAGFAVPVPGVQWICVASLAAVAFLMSGLSRRALADAVVLTVDQYGILDRRLMPRRIAWQEIKAIYPVDTERSHTVDIELRWPKTTLRKTRWPVRVGAYCQIAYGVPALTISMLLLDGSVSDLLDAIAQFRPDLLDYTNRRAPTTAC